MPPMVPIGRLYAEAFWLTVDAREEGRAGTGGAAVEVEAVDVAIGAVGADGMGIEAIEGAELSACDDDGTRKKLSCTYLQRHQLQRAPRA